MRDDITAGSVIAAATLVGTFVNSVSTLEGTSTATDSNDEMLADAASTAVVLLTVSVVLNFMP